MTRITCERCKQDVTVAMYFHGAKIDTLEELMSSEQHYKAVVKGKALCPLCGHEITRVFWENISTEDIIKLAKGKDIDV